MKFSNIVVPTLFFLWLGTVVFFSFVNIKDYFTADMSVALDDGFYVHTLGYFAGSALAWAAFGQKGRWAVVLIPLGLLTLGALLEAAHYFIPARTFNPNDILGNVLGVLLFYGCLLVFLTFRREGGKTHWK